MNSAVPTVTYTRILRGAVTRAGEVWPCDRNLLGVFMGGIATALSDAWAAYDWPLLLEIEPWPYYGGPWAEARLYLEDDIVWHDSQPWICRQATSIGTEPVPDGDDWTQGSLHDPVIEGGFIYRNHPEDTVEVYEDDPRKVPYPRRLRWAVQTFELDGTSIQQIGVRVWPVIGREGLPDEVWHVERVGMPMLEGAEWDEDTAYAVGDGVWFATTGLFYDCITAASAGQSPLTHASKWRLQAIPAFLETYLIHSAVAAFLEAEKGDGPQSKKVREKAQTALEDEMRKAQESDRRGNPAK